VRVQTLALAAHRVNSLSHRDRHDRYIYIVHANVKRKTIQRVTPHRLRTHQRAASAEGERERPDISVHRCVRNFTARAATQLSQVSNSTGIVSMLVAAPSGPAFLAPLTRRRRSGLALSVRSPTPILSGRSGTLLFLVCGVRSLDSAQCSLTLRRAVCGVTEVAELSRHLSRSRPQCSHSLSSQSHVYCSPVSLRTTYAIHQLNSTTYVIHTAYTHTWTGHGSASRISL
jgi:hypothetical protein